MYKRKMTHSYRCTSQKLQMDAEHTT